MPRRGGELTARQRALAFRRFRFPPVQPPPVAAPRAAVPEGLLALAGVPASFDWRTRIAIAPPADQGKCNTCTSFALAAAIEANWLAANPGKAPITVSPGYIHTCLGHQGNPGAADVCATGIDLYAALRLLQEHGYALSSGGDYPFPAASCPGTPRAGRIADFTALAGASEAKAQLTRVGPIVADLYAWQDFFGYAATRAPTYVPDTSRTPAFLHSVCVIGFEARGWILKNSFGPRWGDRGFAIVPYDACGLLGAPPPPGGYPRQAYGVVLGPAAVGQV